MRKPLTCDDDRGGYHIFKSDEIIKSKENGKTYRVKKIIGQGAYGTVLDAVDVGERSHVAIKVCRSTSWAQTASFREVKACMLLKERDVKGTSHCLSFSEEPFWFRQHICLVFDLMGVSLDMYLNKHHPLSQNCVQSMAHQILSGIAFLHNCHIIHADLKPDNILIEPQTNVENRVRPRLKIIDFGFSRIAKGTGRYVGTIQIPPYRAPEICLGIPWREAVDVFAAGCIISELRLGRPLFSATLAKGDLHYLIQMRAFLGPLPDDIAYQAAMKKPDYFRFIRINGNDVPKLDWAKLLTRMEMEQKVKRAAAMKVTLKKANAGFLLFQLLKSLLHYDSHSRISAKQALKHNYFKFKTP